MTKNRMMYGIALIAGLGLAGAAVMMNAAVADEAASVAVEAAPAMPDKAQMMAVMAQMATPGEAHQKLNAFVGSWDVEVKFWMDPTQPPQVSQGNSEIRWVLGGRFVLESFNSTFAMGEHEQEFEGLGMVGYDNATEQYVATWSDTMGTRIGSSTGQFNESNNSLEMRSQPYDCPVMAMPTTMRETMQIIGEDQIVMKMFQKFEGMPESQCLELTYSRK